MTVAIIVFQNDHKMIRKFNDPILLKEFYKDLLEANWQNMSVFAVDRKKSTKPDPDHKVKSGHKWCPYCVADRKFIFDQHLDTSLCEICDVSSNEYHVRNLNEEN